MQQVPYQQQPVAPYPAGYDPNLPPSLPPKKKSSAGIIVLVALLAVAALGAGGWAIYKYVIKPRTMQEQSTTTSSDEERVSFSTESSGDDQPLPTDTTDIDQGIVEPEPEIIDPEPDETYVPSIPEENTRPARPSEPFGMTDEEAAQMRRGDNVPSIPRSKQQRTRPKQPRYNGEPWGMTDEEAAQMNDNYGMPMGMTDEEAAQMRQMQKRKARRYRR